ncbi:Probable low-affinity inorganic phosphate transporter [hydrothermal vent metagenome]|uniref:Probable low-affinity inorganic phosphate transporter n=1 Tax=hydrothermal vent metagenome TaxID=652676 RepID=A0A3B1B693_9ZZZZ
MNIELMAVVGLVLVLLLSWSNGANDISKGIATLVGNGCANARMAVLWGTFCTTLGGLVALLWGAALIKTFSSAFLAASFTVDLRFIASTLIGAAGWVFVATRLGWPVSTTHALLGGVVGAVWAVAGFSGLQMDAVSKKALLPLLISPLIAIGLCAGLLVAARYLAQRVPGWTPGCCDEDEWRQNPYACESRDEKIKQQSLSWRGKAWTGLHWFSSGLTSFARGLNDVPKIAAFLILIASLSPALSQQLGSGSSGPIILVTMVMAAGSLLGSFRVLNILAHRVVPLDASQGLTANIGTSMLVLLASPLGIPVSTTHVSTGSLLGVRWYDRIKPSQGDALKTILFAWLVTLPVAAGLAVLAAAIL